MNRPSYIERALFLLGAQNTGKSTQLRSMFLDPRLGNAGQIPVANNLRNSYAFSPHRRLYLRLTSPHEAGEDMQGFLNKSKYEMSSDSEARRWNFAGALQIDGTAILPDGCEVIEEFVRAFSPERVRAAILSPSCWGEYIEWSRIRSLTDELRTIAGCEVITVDATHRCANGLMFADYFDFA